jgi:hypothetical protein
MLKIHDPFSRLKSKTKHQQYAGGKKRFLWPWSWRQYISPKYCSTTTELHSITTCKTVLIGVIHNSIKWYMYLFIFIAVHGPICEFSYSQLSQECTTCIYGITHAYKETTSTSYINYTQSMHFTLLAEIVWRLLFSHHAILQSEPTGQAKPWQNLY